jgi:hypothetical protein
MADIETEEFQPSRMSRRIVLNELEDFVQQDNIELNNPRNLARLKKPFASDCLESEIAIDSLVRFCHVEPRLPDLETKKFIAGQEPLGIELEMSREEIIDRLIDIRHGNDTADMAFYAYRDLNRSEPWPFLLAAMKRNPISIEGAEALDSTAIIQKVSAMPDESIYDEPARLAQPDEVWNYGRGDGVEKAVLLANILHSRMPDEEMSIEVHPDRASLRVGQESYDFQSQKGVKEQTWPISPFAKEGWEI